MGVPHINPYAGAKDLTQIILLKAMHHAKIEIGVKTKIGRLYRYFANDYMLHIYFGGTKVEEAISIGPRVIYEFGVINDILQGAIYQLGNGTFGHVIKFMSAPLSDPLCFDKVSGFIYLNRVH